MSLQMSYTAADGTVYPECFVNLPYILCYPDTAEIMTSYFANHQAFIDRENPIYATTYSTTTDSIDGDLFPHATAYLLTLPEFAGAVVVPSFAAPAAQA